MIGDRSSIDSNNALFWRDFGAALNRADANKIESIFLKNPEKINLRNPEKERRTPLMLAAQSGTFDIVETILKFNPQLNLKDDQNLTALNIANHNANWKIADLLTEVSDFSFCKTNLNEKLKAIEQKIQDKSLKEVYQFIVGYLSWSANSISNEDILDANFTITNVINILENASNAADFKSNLETFLRTRENFLKGDCHDYCYSDSLANRFSQSLVERVYESKNPLDLLLRNALNEDRETPWYNLYLDENHLPKRGEFFRTAKNHIHLYNGVVERAIANLRDGASRLRDIWFGTDLIAIDTPLSLSDLAILKQRSPTAEKLINYTEALERKLSNDSISITERLWNLQVALEKGDKKNTGTELEAGSVALIETARFAEWWNDLGTTSAGLQLQNKIRAVSESKLGAVIDIILDKNYKDPRGVNYCLQIRKQELQDVLNEPQTQTQLLQLDTSKNIRVTNSELMTWLREINKELEREVKSITTSNNVFRELCEDFTFMSYCRKHPDFSFANLMTDPVSSWYPLNFEEDALNEVIFKGKFSLARFLILHHLHEFTDEQLRTAIPHLIEAKEFFCVVEVITARPELTDYVEECLKNTDYKNPISFLIKDADEKNQVVDIELINQFLRFESLITLSDQHGKTPIDYAISTKHALLISYFLDQHLDKYDEKLAQVLAELIENNSIIGARRLIALKPNLIEENIPFLHLALQHTNDLNLLKELSNEVQWNVVNEKQQRPFIVALRKNSEFAKYAHKNCADVIPATDLEKYKERNHKGLSSLFKKNTNKEKNKKDPEEMIEIEDEEVQEKKQGKNKKKNHHCFSFFTRIFKRKHKNDKEENKRKTYT